MKRRRFIALFGGAAAAWPPALRAQQKAMPVIGLLGVSAEAERFMRAFRQGLGESGYAGEVTFEHRNADFNYDRMPALAADLVRSKVDVIVTIRGTPWALAAKAATSTIPIVFSGVGDPVGIGLIASLNRPGGNLTGFTNISTEMTPKRLELLSEVVSRLALFAVLVNPKNANAARLVSNAQEAARAKAINLIVLNASSDGEIVTAFDSLKQQRAGALIVEPDSFLVNRSKQVVALTSRHAIPAIFGARWIVVAGGLMSYGVDETTVARQAGVYAGKILSGAKPADLPVQQPTKFELAINLKTAKALGLTVPQSLLQRADEVIE